MCNNTIRDYDMERAVTNFAKMIKEKGLGDYAIEVIYKPVLQYQGYGYMLVNHRLMEEAQKRKQIQCFNLYQITTTGKKKYIDYSWGSDALYRLIRKSHPDRRVEIDMLEKKIKFGTLGATFKYL